VGTPQRPVSIAATKLSSTDIVNKSGPIASNEEQDEQIEPSGLADTAEFHGPPATPAVQRAFNPRNARQTRIPRPSCWNRDWGRARQVLKTSRPVPAPHGKMGLHKQHGSVAIQTKDRRELPPFAAIMKFDTGSGLPVRDRPPASATHSDKDPYAQPGQVAIETQGGHEVRPIAAMIQFDTGCEPGNLISKDFLRTAYGTHDIEKTYETSAKVELAVFVDGRACQSFGTVRVRWWTKGFDMRFYTAVCHVVDSKKLDLIIGKPDIIELELFKPNRKWLGCINALYTRRPKVEGSSSPLIFRHIFDMKTVRSVPQQNQAAEAAQAKERDDQAQHEEQEEKARREREEDEKAQRQKN
jgi:hypothetical protein